MGMKDNFKEATISFKICKKGEGKISLSLSVTGTLPLWLAKRIIKIQDERVYDIHFTSHRTTSHSILSYVEEEGTG